MRSKKSMGAVLVATILVAGGAGAQQGEPPEAASVEPVPAALTLAVGETAQLGAVVRDGQGRVVEGAEPLFLSLARDALVVTPDGRVRAVAPGEHQVAVLVPQREIAPEHDRIGDDEPGIRATLTVTVPVPALATVEFVDLPDVLYQGTSVSLATQVLDAGGAERADAVVALESDDPSVVRTDAFGRATGVSPGTATVRARVDGLTAVAEIEVRENPVTGLELAASRTTARTGDVVHFTVERQGSAGAALDGVPVRYALVAWPDADRPESVGAGAPAQVAPDGRFVAEQPGVYTVVAMTGGVAAEATVSVTSRDVGRDVEFVGHAPVRDRVTSDLWVWEGVDGRDYAVHGTWNAEGHAYFYDVTDPSDMVLIDTIQVDARTVNDVKVSEDGRTAVISREGASNRRNGIVILDVTNPHEVEILATFDEQLTGGVHNIFIHDNHVYAVNNGRRWDVINIEDPTRPTRVGRFETDSPGRSVHDVWVRDGIAYQAGRTDGAIMVDVGGGGMGGSPSNPVEMARLEQLTGWNHSAWPFRSRSTGRLYFVAGDEAFYTNPLAPEAGGILWREKIPSRARGWIHFLELDPEEGLREVARYQVPESGPHNYWIDWDAEVMYVGHFDAGLRVVDVSGELMGDLYRQGREIAKFYPDDAEGFTPNAPFVWGPQPHKGTIFFADFNSGLWAIRLVEPRRAGGER